MVPIYTEKLTDIANTIHLASSYRYMSIFLEGRVVECLHLPITTQYSDQSNILIFFTLLYCTLYDKYE